MEIMELVDTFQDLNPKKEIHFIVVAGRPLKM